MILRIPDREYHQDRSRVSQSWLKTLLDHTEAGLKWSMDNLSDPTPQMEFGTLFHLLILEPELFWTSVIACDMASKNSKKYEEFALCNPDKLIVLQKDMDTLALMAKSISRDKWFMDLLAHEHSFKEMCFHWEDSVHSYPCRAKMDLFNPDFGIILDIKTTSNASKAEFSKSIENFKYHMQAAYYINAYETIIESPVEQYVIIAMEKEPPYLFAKYVLSDIDIKQGKALWVEALGRYKKANETGVWPGYGDDVELIERPYWARNKK